MKKLMIGAVALTMLAVSCKKKDDNGTPANSFKVGSTTYSVVNNSITKSGSAVLVSGLNGSTGAILSFSFNGAAAPAAGDYTVVNNDSTEKVGEVSFMAGAITGTSYKSTGSGVVKAKVSYDGSKISISMPDAPAMSTTTSENINVNANISE